MTQNPTPEHIYLEKVKTLNSKRYMHPDVQSSTIYDTQDTKAA